VKPAINEANSQYFELLKTRKQKPLYGTPFKKVNQEADALIYENVLGVNEYLGALDKKECVCKERCALLVRK
jgi:hypothetical protein